MPQLRPDRAGRTWEPFFFADLRRGMGAMRTKGGPKPYYIRRRDSCPISKPSPVKDLGTNTQHEIGWRNLGKEGLFKKNG